MISKKCPKCRGCMTYKKDEKRPYLYCDFCDKLFYRVPGGKLIEKEISSGYRYKFGL